MPQMENYFDFQQAAIPEDSILPDPIVQVAEVPRSTNPCPSHPNNNCICHGFLDDFLPDPVLELEPETTGLADQGEGFQDFSAFLPRYSKPEDCCGYCREKNMECFFTYEGQASCSPCNALFRPCSFNAHNEGMDMPQRGRNRSVMDTLHLVPEDVCQEAGALTGIVALRSWNRAGVDAQNVDAQPKGKNGMRFSRSALKILKDWMAEHRTHPYPTEEEKAELAARTDLLPAQISNWMANTRRRTKTKQRGVSPSIRSPIPPSLSQSPSSAINIRPNADGITHSTKWERMNPLERWKHSPPENEPAAVADIATAVAQSFYQPFEVGEIAPIRQAQLDSTSNGSTSLSKHRPRSTTSHGTGPSWSALSSGSHSRSHGSGSAYSYGSRNSFGSFGSGIAKKERRRRRRPATKPLKTNDEDNRPFQCTFCTDKFKSKYDWTRHEKSLHLSLEKWICGPLGEVVTDSATGVHRCVYCDTLNPDRAHLDTHNHRACEEKGLESRTFYRKDHLRQHLRLMHGCKLIPSMESWKSENGNVRSRCGFCDLYFESWSARNEHLSKHFRAGAKMVEWKSCRGFDCHVAAMVTNAMPPYLIGNESISLNPFSATTNPTTQYHHASKDYIPIHIDGVAYPMEGAFPEDLGMPTKFASTPSGTTGTGHASGSGSGSSPASGFRDAHLQPIAQRGVPLGATCWEILTIRLGKFVREMQIADPGVQFTDKLLQKQARFILYEEEDDWNQTPADNEEWLELFKKAHGLIPGTFAQEDWLEDLGAEAEELRFDGVFDMEGFGDEGNSFAMS
ncbi:hypothetical protein P152DRAFT_457136 [Eremomyces bilateralis CBS 781.70]|uniref:Homeobox and C2H2 transcription factor n=1 Tax=Eremomyces bilateralis CBS 781.70 TaxID=1392243 RepID=A0A6G1G6S3_9PEZI|nr:uncharacterized protein P152DRAFT_457136 [Eremomyces bilateralis CBS 781.70]KAF1813767.1 hypothetical protein P152DRAFT_457136 [Eremomyces bilateralis CBS 781.70]